MKQSKSFKILSQLIFCAMILNLFIPLILIPSPSVKANNQSNPLPLASSNFQPLKTHHC